MKEYQNYLFDLYGTLVDIHTVEGGPAFWRSCCRLLGMQGVPTTPAVLQRRYEEGVREMEARLRRTLPAGAEPEIDLGVLFAALFREAGAAADERTVADFARTFRLLSIKRLKLFPGVMGMLDALHRAGKRVYLLSNAQALFTRPELTLLGLEEKLDGILLSSEAGRKKPDPAFYRMALERFSLNPAETAMVGNDDRCDCWGAHNAGLDSFYVCTRQSPPRRSPLPENCWELSKIADLADKIQRS